MIGLYKNGYGCILVECMFILKIFYCYWVCMVEDYDDFVCEIIKLFLIEIIFIVFNSDVKVDYKIFIKCNVLGKFNEELF